MGQVHRCDGRGAIGAAEHGFERLAQHVLQLALELTARDLQGVIRTAATDQNDAGGQRIGTASDHAVAQFGAHGPGAVDGETGTQHGGDEGFPAGGSGAVAAGVGLLEGVVDRDRERTMRLFGDVVHGRGHAIEEELLRAFLAAVAIRRGDQLFSLGHGDGGEQRREGAAQRAAQPDIEEIRQVGIADVVVVRRIC